MAVLLKQSTQVIARFGPYLDKTDAVTEEVGLAGAATEISKNHAAFGAGPVLGTHDAEGWYPITLTTTHTDTLGPLLVKAHDSATHLPVWREFLVVPANVYDSIVSGSDRLEVDAMEISADATAADNLETMLDGTGGQELSLGRLVISGSHAQGVLHVTNSGAGAAVYLTGPDGIQIIPTSTYGIYISGGAIGIYAAGATYDIQADIQGAVSGAVGSVTGAVGSVTGAVTVGTINDGAIAADAVADMWSTTTIAEAYATDGSAATPAQLLYMLWAAVAEFAISGTTITAKKIDGSTTAMTFTLDDSDNPTSRTRAT